MAQTDYIGFQCDYSDNGVLRAKMDVPIKRKLPGSGRPKPANGEPDLEEATLLVPLWLPLALNADGEETVVEGTHFFIKIEIFIEKGEFEKRLPKKWPACRDVYNADWASARQDDSLACSAHDDDGLEIGAKGARAWPRAGLIAANRGSEVTRYYAQAAIWEDITTTSMSAGSSRLWKPASWNEAPLKIYFTPCSAWPSFAKLKEIADDIKKQEQKKEANKTSRRLGLTTWLDWDVPGDASAVQNLVLMSTNLLRLYNTYISQEDLQRLVRAQTQDGPDWRRSWPARSVAQEIHKQMLDNLAKFNPQHHKLMSGGLKKTSTTWISSTKTFGIRIDANKIMGSKSANQLGKEWWGSGEGAKVVAEWLHRSAYSLGPLRGSSDFQSPDNIVFGTFEANSDMTRAETAIRTLRDVQGAEGTLTTTVVNDDLPDNDRNRLLYLDPASGKAEPWEIDKWIGEENYAWIAPNLIYTGTMTLSEHKLPVLWATRFHTFSRYSPLMLEGKMDTRILSEYLKTHFPSGAKRPRVGTAATSTSSNTPSLDTPSDLAADITRVRLSRSVALYAWPNQIELPVEDRLPSTGNVTPAPTPSLLTEPLSGAPLVEGTLSDQDPSAVIVHPSTHAAWKSIYEKAGHVHLGDVRVGQPHIADDGNDIGDPGISPPATGFMLEGTIKLFGLDSHEVTLQSWHGPPPPDVEIGADVPVYQRVQLQSIRPAELVPLLKGAFFSEFEFESVTITYQNYQLWVFGPQAYFIR
ncbi:hypothetical protein FRC06_003488 [Ceratobasidium sp. 370]|nr:hypothetical protein FRC06_003488 [Ceratobasidium sp. 370]